MYMALWGGNGRVLEMSAAFDLGKVTRETESTAVGYGSGPARIIVTAEHLFGQHGIHNVSLRQIAVAAGQGNHSAVALHFGSKAGLIEAVVKARRSIIDDGRRQRLERVLAQTSEPDLRQLLECLLMPWADDVDEAGNHPYACFLAQLMWAEEADVLLTMLDEAPICAELLERIRDRARHLEGDVLSFRIRLVMQMFLTAALHKGRVPLSPLHQMDGSAVFAQIVTLGTAMLLAPASDVEV